MRASTECHRVLLRRQDRKDCATAQAVDSEHDSLRERPPAALRRTWIVRLDKRVEISPRRDRRHLGQEQRFAWCAFSLPHSPATRSQAGLTFTVPSTQGKRNAISYRSFRESEAVDRTLRVVLLAKSNLCPCGWTEELSASRPGKVDRTTQSQMIHL